MKYNQHVSHTTCNSFNISWVDTTLQSLFKQNFVFSLIEWKFIHFILNEGRHNLYDHLISIVFGQPTENSSVIFQKLLSG